MHRLPSKSAVTRIRLASLLIYAKCLITPVAAGILAYSATTGEFKPSLTGTCLLMAAGIVVLFQWMTSAHTRCPLCMTPVLGNKRCMKHRSARTFLGSYRLRVALAVLCLNRFRCPYCGEVCEVKARVRRAY